MEMKQVQMAGQDGVILYLKGLTKTFSGHAAVDAVDLEILEGELFTNVGPSGSGKTTLLRMLAGMESPTSGDIILRGERINDIPANRRPTCMVFQSLALFPHKEVGANIEFSLKIRGVDAETRKRRALELMELLRLPEAYYGRGRWLSIPKSCSSTSRSRRSTTSCARPLRRNSRISIARRARLSSTSRTAWKRRW